jgi:hypothetical protein
MKRWIWYVIGAVILALAGGGVLYGVLTHKEAGFMEVCWKGGQAHYTGCDTTKPLKWSKDKLPIPYYIDFDKDHQTYVESVTTAADLWNREVGVALFKRVKLASDSKLIIKWGAVDGDKAGHTSHRGDDRGPTSSEVVLVEASDVRAVHRFAAHELGHVLGLAHDEHAVMQPTAPGMSPDKMQFILPSDHDKKLLQETYR